MYAWIAAMMVYGVYDDECLSKIHRSVPFLKIMRNPEIRDIEKLRYYHITQ
jgi:hypothetical protein